MHWRNTSILGRFLFCGELPRVGTTPRHPQLDHHPLLAFVIDQEMAMKEKVPVFLKVRARHRLAPRAVGIERRGPQNDVLAVERSVAVANRHRRLPRVVPHRSKAIRFGIEAGNSGASALRPICPFRAFGPRNLMKMAQW